MSILRTLNEGWGNDSFNNFDKESMEHFDAIFELLERIEPMGKYNNYKAIWLCEPRGSLSDMNFEDIEEACEYFGVEDESQLEEAFLKTYPEENYWILFESANDNDYRVIQINKCQFIVDEKAEEKGYEYNFTEAFSCIKNELEKILEQGSDEYNRRVEKELPYTHRYGIVRRKDYYKHNPEIEKNIFKDISDAEIQEFLDILNEESGSYIPSNKVKEMTFTQYFEYASVAFKAAGFDIEGKTEFEQFRRYGEDFGGGILYEIDPDSPKDFMDYYNGEHRMGGHPWGLVRGSSRTRIYLFPKLEDDGFYFSFNANHIHSIYEMIKMYPALKKAGVPVVFNSDKDRIKEYIAQEDLIGIVPYYRLPVYCQLDFPEHKVESFVHYDPEEDEGIKERIQWQPNRKIVKVIVEIEVDI